MLDKLKAKWKVNTGNLVLIIITFAIGGSLCGIAGRKILGLLDLDQDFLYFFAYILLLTLLWPVCVLVVSIPLGQFAFFKRYIRKITRSMAGGKSESPVNVAIFASGGGSNALKIIQHFSRNHEIRISLIVSNRSRAGVVQIAKEHQIKCLILEKDLWSRTEPILNELKRSGIDFIVLAGFLLKVPSEIIKAYPGRIINIHPALLPSYGGKGMYGMKVHEAVRSNNEKQSGISIHFVDEIYDHGEIIFQQPVDLSPNDSALTIAQKVLTLEHMHYPPVIEKFAKVKGKLNKDNI